MNYPDRLFKELISTFFLEFIELFLPEVFGYISPDSLTFLPQEIFTDITSGERREIDLLAQVKFRGVDSCFLIHLENQSYNQPGFARRMFHYFSRLDEKYGLPIYPVVVFSYDEPKRAETDRYEVKFSDRQVLTFNFMAIQLNRLNWRSFLSQPNPVAAALMSKMQFNIEDRPRVKLECLRMLATLRLNPAKMQLISSFVDTYLRLNASEEQIFTSSLKTLGLQQEEAVMEIVTSWMELGIQQGIERGIERGEKGLVLSQLNRRLGAVSANLQQQIGGLPIDLIEELGLALLDFSSEEDLVNWLNENKPNN